MAWAQKGRVALGATLGTLWTVGLTLPPYLLSRAIDDDLAPGWVLALLGAGLVNAWLAMMRHRTMTKIRMDANFRTVRALVEQINTLGADLNRRACWSAPVPRRAWRCWRASAASTARR
ncbi:hypothetical protein ABT158_39675 [Nonomuraea sp. NPDC001636]|uniref:hypothetical protein n=1 Tax=Nonomuraea sp. NPDC001636 TaxID=3154391 RepID=UPI00331AA070